jgi:hypothetical protein
MIIQPSDTLFNFGGKTNISFQEIIDIIYTKLDQLDPQGYSTLWTEFNALRDAYYNFTNPLGLNGTYYNPPTWEDSVQYRQAIINKGEQILLLSSVPANYKAPEAATLSATQDTGSTKAAQFNNPVGIDDMKNNKDDLQKKITQLQSIGLPSLKDLGKQIWENMIQPKILSPRQISKKILLMQGQSMNPPLSEEDAQLIVYGKVYYKDGELYDNDNEDPACVSQPTDDDYSPPLDENHPLWEKIKGMFKDIEDGLLQLGIKLGEFILAQPQAIAQIITSLISLASSITIMPFGSGLPTAITAVQTMMATIKTLQQKTAEILPLLGIIDIIGLILPKDAQAVLAQVNIIIGIYLGILTAITAILSLLGGVTDKLQKSKDNMNNQPLKIEPKIENIIVDNQDYIKLSANATGSDWGAQTAFQYEWTDQYLNVITRDPASTGDDDGTRTIPKPASLSSYQCKVTDGKGATEEGSIVYNS